MKRTIVVLCLSLALLASGCSMLAPRTARVDSRTDFPGARPFDESTDELPGETPANAAALRGAWFAREQLIDVVLPSGAQPRLNYSIWLWLSTDGTYDLVYQAYWGSRARSAAAFGGIDVRESGRFVLSGDSLTLEPQTARGVEVGRNGRRTIAVANERREYLARRDRGYLNLAGPCAAYQVEPLCRRGDVWRSLRSVSTRSPDEVPEL